MISVNNVSVFYGERVLLDNISFTIGTRDRIGLTGRNGAGKSTMMKIISGLIKTTDGGNIARPSGSTIGYLHQDMFIPGGKTVIDEAMTAFDEVKKLEENLERLNKELHDRTDYESDSYMDLIHDVSEMTERFHLIGGDQAEIEAERVLKGLGFKSSDMQRMTEEFSGGWQMRIELAKMLLNKPDYLLLDEPTNHLDIESIIWLENFLVDYPGAVVVISHDKTFLDNVTKRTLEIELGKMYDYKANYSRYLELRAERRALLENSFKNQQKFIAEREKTINRFMAKATKTSMAQSMQKQLDKIERIELDEPDKTAMNIKFPPAPRSGQVVIDAKNLSKSFGKVDVLSEIELKLDRGDRVAFVGQNGQGKTTLAKILIEREEISGGEIGLGHNVAIGYYAQNQAEALQPNITLEETMQNHCPPEMRTRIRAILGAFMFSGEDAEKKVSVLSGGERARLALACLLLNPFNLLVLDEPTNHLDMLSKEILKDAIMQYDGTLIIVSHDRDFLTDLTNRTIEFKDKKLYEHLGDVNYFLEKRKLDNMRDVELRDIQTAANKINKNGVEDKEKSKLERAIKNSEKRISELENEIKKISDDMGDANFYKRSDYQKTVSRFEQLKKELDTEMEVWDNAQMAMS